MAILELLKDTSFWETTYAHMGKKSNFKHKQIQTLEYLKLSDFYTSAIERIEKGTYTWSVPLKHLRNKSGTNKKRVVYIHELQDRVLLGVLYRVCSAYFQDDISNTCFSYKKGVYTLNAVEHLLQDKRLFQKYGVKIDISAYFNSVSKNELEKIIQNLFGQQEPCILKLIQDVMLTDTALYKGQLINEYKSLIPGCAFSSFFANYCLKDLDHLISDTLGFTYARYSDDIILFADTKEEVEKCLDIIKEQLNRLGLKINPSKYEWYEPNSSITFLGLQAYQKNDTTYVDIGEHSLHKIKRRIHHSAKLSRAKITRNGANPQDEVRKLLKAYNYRTYKCYIEDSSKYGWGYYAFRYINTIDSLRQVDDYLQDRMRYVLTGKNNKANLKKVSKQQLIDLGYVSLVDMYKVFQADFDVYCDKVYLI